MTDQKSVLIAGYYGFGNIGDETILTTMIGRLRLYFPTITVVSGHPAATAAAYAVQAVGWRDLAAILTAAESSDLIILGGGGLFQDYWGVDPSVVLTRQHSGLAYFSTFPVLAALLDKPLMLFAVGVGPLLTDAGRAFTRLAFEQAAVASVRDQPSQREAAQLTDAEIALTADPAFLLEPAANAEAIFARESIPTAGLRVGVALRHWELSGDPERWSAEIAAALDCFIEQTGASVLFIPFQAIQPAEGALTDDRAAAERVRRRMKHPTFALTGAYTPAETLAVIARCQLIVAMRLHAAILAARAAVPVIGLAYDPKVAHILGDLGFESLVLDLNTLTTDMLLDRLTTAHQQRDHIAPALRDGSRRMARLAERNLDLALTALNRPAPPLSPLAADLLKQRARLAIRQVEQIAALSPGSDPVAIVQRLTALLDLRSRRLTERSRQVTAARQANRDLDRRLETAAAEQDRLQQQINARDQQLVVQNQQIDQLHAEAAERLNDYTNQIESRDQTIDQQATALEQRQQQLTDQADHIAQQREQIAARDQTIDWQAAALDQRQQQIGELEQRVDLYQDQIAQRDQHIVGYYEQIAQQHQVIHEREQQLAEAEQQRSVREQQIAEQEQARAAEIQTLTARRNYLQTQLDNAHATRAWRAASFYWRTRDTLLRSPRGLYRRLIPTSWRLRFRDFRAGRLQTAHAYAFDLYRRRRSALYGDHLRGITAPAESDLVSIVLPIYNGADMLGEAVESVLLQTYTRFELIIVNDGSTDESGSLADDYAHRDPRVRVIHQPNQQLPRALSNGFRATRGAYLTWTSADNRLKPDFLARLVACMQRHPDWDMIYANLDIIGEEGAVLRGSAWYQGYQRPIGSGHVHLPANTAELNTLENNFIGAAFMYRAPTAALLGDYSPLRFKLEDYDYWMRVNDLLTLRHADFDKPVYEYRFHPKSLTARHLDEIIHSREQLMRFDTFRRDFALAPLLWIIDGAAPALERHLQAANHLLYQGSFPLDQLPPLWLPTVYICVTEQAVACNRADLPASALKVLVVTEPTLPDQIDPAWDVGVAFGRRDALPRLPRPYQGWLAAADAAALFRLIDIRAKSEHLRQLEPLIEVPPPPECRVSVVICTHRFNRRLLATLRAAAAQCGADDELIVVNNRPDQHILDHPIEQMRREFFPDQPDRLRLIACPPPGLSAARNAGIAVARGEVIAFLDDDALPAPGWLDAIAQAFAEHPQTGVIGGHIELKIPQPRPAALRPGWEKYWSQYVTGFTDYTEVDHWWEFPWGANWSARRAALLRIGGFRLNYGRSGDNFWGGEELVAARQIHQAGYAVAVLPSARVLHDVDESRFTFHHVRQTLAAGRLVYYLLQRDLFIPRESGLSSALRDLLTVRSDPALAGQPFLIRLLDRLFRQHALLLVIGVRLRDLRGRLRRPHVAG